MTQDADTAATPDMETDTRALREWLRGNAVSRLDLIRELRLWVQHFDGDAGA